MKRIITIVFALLLACGVSYSQTVNINKIISLNAYGPVPAYLPTTLSIVCDGTGAAGNNCPQYWSPDWTDTTNTRAYGYSNQNITTGCLKSTDAAVTWTACNAHPFSSTYLSTPIAFGVAQDGSLLAATRVTVATETCVIKRSTDGGDSWTTVFTQAGTHFCGAWGTTALQSPLRCAKASPTCVLLGWDIASNVLIATWVSNDYGASWAYNSSSTNNGCSSPAVRGPYVSDDGTVVSTSCYVTQAVSKFWYSRDGTTFVNSVAYGSIPFTTQCMGQFVYNGNPAFVCSGDSSATSTSKLLVGYMNGTVPTTVTTHLLTNGDIAWANGIDFQVRSYDEDSGIHYLVIRHNATQGTNVYVTTDNWVSLHFLGRLTPTIPFNANVRGDMYKWGNAIYWSSGYHTPNGHIMKVS